MRKFQLIAFIGATLACSNLALCQKSQAHPESSSSHKAPSPSQREFPVGYTQGPAMISLANGQGTLRLPDDYVFLDINATKEFFTSNKQPIYPDTIGMVADPRSNVHWYATISYTIGVRESRTSRS